MSSDLDSRRDAALATAVLTVAVVVGVVARADPSVPWLVGGALLTIVAEALAGRYRRSVERRWASPAVRAGAVAVAVVAIIAVATVAPDLAVSVAVGALVTYLVLLALVRAEILGFPER